MKQVIKELIIQKKYILFTGVLTIFLMLPQLVLSYDIKHFIMMVFTLILLFLLAIVSKTLFIISSIYISIFNIIVVHVAMHWGYAYADLAPRFAVVMDSPKSETLGYLSTFLDYRDVLNILYFIVILYFIYQYIKKYNNKFKTLRWLTFFILLLSIYGSFNYLKEREPYNVIPKIISILKGNKYVEQRDLYLKSMNKYINENKSLIYDKIIFILGESVNKHHMGIYGYKDNTTPFLSKIKKNKNFYQFNVISPSNQTRISVPIYMTNATIENFYKGFIYSSSILRDYSLNGYNAIWLSAQGKVGHKNDFIAACANDANKSIFLNNFYNTWAKKDIEIVNYLKNNRLQNDKQMFVLHLSGSHVKYSNRYEKDDTMHTPAKNIIEEYDNSIYYTDNIIKKIFKTLIYKNEKVLLIYTSDHGEVVDVNKNGHGFSYPYKDEYDIPFVIYSSIKNNRIDKLKIQNNRHFFNMENIYSYMAYISGMKDDINISTNMNVIAVDPKYKYKYDELKYYKKEIE